MPDRHEWIEEGERASMQVQKGSRERGGGRDKGGKIVENRNEDSSFLL